MPGRLAPHNPLKIYNGQRLPAPGVGRRAGDPRFLLGTDSLGRDVLSRTIYGARVSMAVGLIPTVIILVIGAVIGMMAGFPAGSMR